MKYLKKTLSFVLAFAMMFTMVIVPKTSVSEAAASDYTYFDTTMFNYDTDTFNAATKALEKMETKVYTLILVEQQLLYHVEILLMKTIIYGLDSRVKRVKIMHIQV